MSECPTCGQSFNQPRRDRHQTFCSIGCSARATTVKKCVRCGINTVPRHWAKHCSDCRYELDAANNHRQFVRDRLRRTYDRLGGEHCRGCDRRFMPPYSAGGGSRRKFCTETCARGYWHGYQADLRRGAMVVPKAMISIQVIGDRDGWKCHICRKHVHRKDAARDHLIPISHGGDSHPANLAIAHRWCNSKRYDGRMPAQLRLVG